MQSVIELAQAEADSPGGVLAAAWPRTWAKIVHLIFLPLLDATRPWQLRYALGDGLLGVCQIAYRFDTIDRALGELKHLQVGDALRQALCRPWLDQEIALVNPKLIIPIGRLAVGLFFDTKLALQKESDPADCEAEGVVGDGDGLSRRLEGFAAVDAFAGRV